ncbi:MAG TPA: LysR family transcriptional regulator [Polyangiaceae bacterium]|nr:LysR family transcriptional regulator [Polyangiaceae bacterium]
MKQLRLLLVVSRTHSLRAAARKLGVSQATVSEGARELERRCGFEVFDRGFYNTYVAHECRYVLEQARRVLDEYEKLLDMIAKVGRRLAIRDRP